MTATFNVAEVQVARDLLTEQMTLAHKLRTALERITEHERGYMNSCYGPNIVDQKERDPETFEIIQASADAIALTPTKALAQHNAEMRRTSLEQAKTIALGCKDFGGGYKDPAMIEAFHHGMKTVANAIQGLIDHPESLQSRILMDMGSR
jgi:hypothetical protein